VSLPPCWLEGAYRLQGLKKKKNSPDILPDDIAHLRNPPYLGPFREEKEAVFDGDELIDLKNIQYPKQCPQRGAVWHETLSVAGWSASVRLITRDVVCFHFPLLTLIPR
jgi:hypothetical protein